jgi:PAS domain S-box-containing protein
MPARNLRSSLKNIIQHQNNIRLKWFRGRQDPKHDPLIPHTSQEGTWDWNLKTGENRVSEKWAQMIGYRADEISHDHQTFKDHIHPDDYKHMETIRTKYLQGELPEYHVVFRMITKSGHFRWILSKGRIVEWDKKGNPLRMVGTHQDITRQKRQEQRLRRQKSMFESFFKHSPLAIVFLDRDSKIIQINEQFTRLFGYTEECKGVYLDSLVTDENLLPEAEEITRRSKQDEMIDIESVRLHKDGSRIPVAIRSSQVKVDGEVIGYQIIYTDISRRKQEEAQLIEAKLIADAANQVKSRFLSNMSHELRTPMHGIYGSAMLLEVTPLSEEQQEMVQILKESTSRMVDTVNDLLDVSRIESGKIELKEEVFELNQIIEEILEPFRILNKSRDLTISVDTGNIGSTTVVGDRSKLSRVLYHLVSNAYKFTQRGSITLKLDLNRFEESIGLYEFTVTDTGIGIEQSNLKKLFRSFSQLDDSYSKAYQGIGLGLAIVQELVELMGGTICVESIPGDGSSFCFEIPLKIHKHSGRNVKSWLNLGPLVQQEKPLSILAVEDDEISQLLLQKIAPKIGAEIDLAKDGFEAIRKFGSRQYDLVLMDVQLPTINGIEVTSVIRSFEKKFGERTPIIGLSAYAMKQDQERCLEAGMNDYLSKPLNIEKLNKVIQQWVR